MFWKYHGLGNDFVILENFDGGRQQGPGLGDGRVRPPLRHRGRRHPLHRTVGKGRRHHEGPELRRLRGGDVRQRHPMRGQAPLRFRHRQEEEDDHRDPGRDQGDRVHGDKGAGDRRQGGHGRARAGMRQDPDDDARASSSIRSLEVDGKKVRGTAVSMGNPHFIIFQDFTDEEQDGAWPRRSRRHAHVPQEDERRIR